LIIQFMALIEETRDLILQEWNFRNILSEHLQTLLEQQKLTGSKEGISNGRHVGMQELNSSMLMPQSNSSRILYKPYKIVKVM
jgi:hypothetical protein